MSPADQGTYATDIESSNNAPAKARLYKLLDTDHDNKLSADDIRKALVKPWLSQPISQMVTKYESEWYYNAQKWDSLDVHLTQADGQVNADWVAEKKRIQGLAWWGDLAGKQGISADGVAWHVHPISSIDAFGVGGCELITYVQIKSIFPHSSDAKREEVRGYLTLMLIDF